MPVKATLSYDPPPSLLFADPEQRDRTTAEYREHRDMVMRPDIRRRGVQMPLLAYPEGERKRLFDGGTRLECALLEALESVPVLTFPAPPSGSERRLATFLANENRLDFAPAERARFYLDTMRSEGWTQAEMCRQIHGLKPARVAKTLKWLERLLPEYHAKVGKGDGLIPERGAYLTCDFAPEQQREYSEKFINGLLTVEAMEDIHARHFGKAKKKIKPVRLRTARGLQAQLPDLDHEAAIAELSLLTEAVKKAHRLGLPLSSVPQLLKA